MVLSIESPPCVQRAIIFVLIACTYICCATLAGAGAPAIQTTWLARGGQWYTVPFGGSTCPQNLKSRMLSNEGMSEPPLALTIFSNLGRRSRYSSTRLTASDLTVMLPLASTSCAPNEAKSDPTQSTESVVCPRPRPKGLPALNAFSAATTKLSQFHCSASFVDGLPCGYIARISLPQGDLSRSMRAPGGLICVPVIAGTPSQWPSLLTRYSIAGDTLPFCFSRPPITSSTGSRLFASESGYHARNCRMSWPACACDSAVAVIMILLPCEGM